MTARVKKERPEISHVERISVPPREAGNAGTLQSAVLETLKTLLANYQKFGAPHDVRVILASPWYEAHLKTIVSKSEKPVRVTHGTVLHAVEGYKKQQGADSSAGGNRTLIESAVTQAYVNGYQTMIDAPLLGTALKIELYESFVDTAFVAELTNAIHSVFHNAKISFHSFPLVSFVVLRSIRDEEGFTFVDIGGEVTDVAIIHKDGLRFLGSFPKGTKALVADVASGKSEPEAISRLSLYTRGELSPDEQAAFEVQFQKAAAAWNTEYEKMLETAVSDVPIPHTAFLIADKEELSWFRKVVEGTTGRLFPTRPIPLTPDFFQSSIMVGEGSVYDAFLSLEALFFHTETKELIEIKKSR